MAAFLQENRRWLGAGMLIAFVSSFGQTFFVSVFAGEIRTAFALTDGQWGRLYATATTASAVIVVFAGGLADRYPARRLGSVVFAGLAAACLAMALAPGVPALFLAVLMLRFFGQGMSSHLAGVAMASWFTATRGRALAVAGLGFALGESLLPVGFVAALPVFGHRTLWLACAVVVLAAIVPLRALLRIDRSPAGAAAATAAAGDGGRHWTRAEVLASPVFWALVPLLLGPPAFGTALFFQQVHLAEAKGWSHLGLVALFPGYTIVSIAASLSAGVLLDRYGTRALLPGAAVPLAAAFLILGAAQTLAGAALALAVAAVTVGANHTLVAAFWAERYGTRHLGAIKAMGTAIMVLGSAIGPLVTGALIDRGTDFPAQMPWIAAYLLAAAALAGAALNRGPRRAAVR
ncbi:MAG: MFS transporter [Hasllibacter sp.]